MKFETQIYASWKGKQKQTKFMWNSTPSCTTLNARNFVQTNRVEWRTKCWWQCFSCDVFMVIWVILHENCVTTPKKCNGFLQSFFLSLEKIFLCYLCFDSTDFFFHVYLNKKKRKVKRSMISYAWVEKLNGLICIWKRKSDPHENV